MSCMRDHNEWFRRTTNDASGRTAAAAAGIPIATLNRQLAKNHLSPEFVIAIARAYETRPVAALVQTGYLETSETGSMSADEVAELLSDQDLIRIMAYRVNADEAAWAGTFDEVIEEATPGVRPNLYVADDTDTEPEEGDEGYHDGP